MDRTRVGMDVRLLRRRRGWTQEQLGSEAKVSRSTISAIEHGRAERASMSTLIAVVEALGARLSMRIYWHGEALDRMRDERHAALVDRILRVMIAHAWVAQSEVTFNEFGERGSIDVLACHPGSGALLVIEVKSVVPDLQDMLSTLDRKTRLAPGLARKAGWRVRSVSRLLVLPEDRTVRRRVAHHSVTFDVVLPLRNAAVKRWLRSPDGPIAGVLFVTDVAQDDKRPNS
jgi:transcriptional regulator with XRE-family HTH domain